MAVTDDRPASAVGENTSAPGDVANKSVSGGELDPNRLVEKLPQRKVPISSLVPGLYLREAGTDTAHVRLLADLGGSSSLPPVLVQEYSFRIIDGMHRIEAARLRGDNYINACFINCTDEEALVLAIQSNTLHGLPLSKADRISGAKRILATHANWSDRAIAGIAGLSPKTIASLRNRSGDDQQPGAKRLGRDGRRRPAVIGESSKRACEYIRLHPDASVRRVAREANVSLGTVHDVRERILRGLEDKPAVPAVSRTGFQPKKAEQTTLTWAEMSAKISQDPVMRYTEGGRAFLRWMALHAGRTDEWREFVDAVPVHWLSAIGRIADAISEEWSEFASQLKNKQHAAS